MTIAAATLGKILPSISSSSASSWKSRDLPLRGDLGGVSFQDSPPPFASDLVLRRASSPVLAVPSLVLELQESSLVEVP
jgi:hypothetical protein